MNYYYIMMSLGLAISLSGPVLAQEEEANSAKTVLSEELWASPRAEGMGGALTGLADGIDAPLYNPAGIGGRYQDGKVPLVHRLDFPMIGGSANQNASSLYRKYDAAGADDDTMAGQGLLQAAAGKRQYARTSLWPNLGVGSLSFGYLVDSQFAAVPSESGEQVDLHSRVVSGPTAGLSVADRKQRFRLGIFAADVKRTEIEATFAYADIAESERRRRTLREESKGYRGTPGNVGFIWLVSPKANTAISASARDVGGTTYSRSLVPATPADPTVEELKVAQNLALAFSLSPRLSKWGWFNFDMEVDKFHEAETALAKKLKAGMELSLGGEYGQRSFCALRLGGTSAGASYGLGLNLGLLNLQYADHAVDIGATNQRLIERRQTAIFRVNVADY